MNQEKDILKDILNTLKVVFEYYADELKEKHDILLDEYDLADLEHIIKSKE